MILHCIRHVAYEGPGFIEDWARENRIALTETIMTVSPTFPAKDTFDGLIIMGGPMSVYDIKSYPWLIQEKKFIRETIARHTKVLGICLGAQLVSDVLGGRVYPNTAHEIGWFPVSKEFILHSWFPDFDDQDAMAVFHWHGDTFDLPRKSIHLFSSEASRNQAFLYDDHVLAIQFHPEMKEDIIRSLIDQAGHDIKRGRFTQTGPEMLAGFTRHGIRSKNMLYTLLDYFFID
jgi:GMP synthase-like glutamine amidotransferase